MAARKKATVETAQAEADATGTPVPVATGVDTVVVAVPRKYTDEQREALLTMAMTVLGQLPYGAHPDVVVNRTKLAFEQAELMLPVYEATVNKEADNGQA